MRLSFYCKDFPDSPAFDDGHCLAINAMVACDTGMLFTGGRDGMVCGWEEASTEKKTLSQTMKLDHHADWINDLIVSGDSRLLVSASNDHLVKVWDIDPSLNVDQSAPLPNSSSVRGQGWPPDRVQGSTGRLVQSLGGVHRDYVTSLASGLQGSVEHFFSASLDGIVVVWDLQQARAIASRAASPSFMQPKAKLRCATSPINSVSKQRPSIYALGYGRGCVVAGCSDGSVWSWDPRVQPTTHDSRQYARHSDVVKALLVSDDGRMCLSASSDGTVKLCSLGGEREPVIADLGAHDLGHTDSVWCLASLSASFESFVTGSRDGSVRIQDRKSKESRLVVSGSESVLALAVAPGQNACWVSTTVHSEARLYSTTQKDCGLEQNRAGCLAHTRSHPGIVKHCVLNNRRHVVTESSDGKRALWDTVLGRAVSQNVDLQSPPATRLSFDELVQKLNKERFPVFVGSGSWMTADSHTGRLSISFDRWQVFNVEVTREQFENPEKKEVSSGDWSLDAAARAAGQSLKPAATVYVGELVTRALLSRWVENNKIAKQMTLEHRKSVFEQLSTAAAARTPPSSPAKKASSPFQWLFRSTARDKSDRDADPATLPIPTISETMVDDALAKERPAAELVLPSDTDFYLSDSGSVLFRDTIDRVAACSEHPTDENEQHRSSTEDHGSSGVSFDDLVPVPLWASKLVICPRDLPRRKSGKVAFRVVRSRDKTTTMWIPSLESGKHRLAAPGTLLLDRVLKFIIEETHVSLPETWKRHVTDVQWSSDDADNTSSKRWQFPILFHVLELRVSNRGPLPLWQDIRSVNHFRPDKGNKLTIEYAINETILKKYEQT